MSANDNYQRSNGISYLENSYWCLDHSNRSEPEVHPPKQFVIHIPSSQQGNADSVSGGYRYDSSWPPLDEETSKPCARQVHFNNNSTYKTFALPIRPRPASPSWKNSRPRGPAHNEILLSLYLDQPTSPVAAFLNSLSIYMRRIPEPRLVLPEETLEQDQTSTVTEGFERPPTSHALTAAHISSRDKPSLQWTLNS